VRPHHFDLVVIGGGAAGLAAARTGVRRGARTLLVSDGEPGGDCTFTGCVPSKTLIEAAAGGVAYAEAVRRVHAVVARVAASENAATLRTEGMHVWLGRARFTGRKRVVVDGTTVTGDRFVVATGSRPHIPPIPGLAQAGYLTNENVFDQPDLPDSLLVLGGGTVGCELAQAFRRLGTSVTVVETRDRLLAAEEPQASATLADVFAREGILTHLGSAVEQVGEGRLTLRGGTELPAERVLVATGRRPATDGLDLELAGIRGDSTGYIGTSRFLATSAPGVYAAGDVTGRLQLTHAADAMGRRAAHNALGRIPTAYREHAIPQVTFTDPEVARVGLVEADAPAHARVAELPMSAVDRALAAQATDGFVKLIAGPRRGLGALGGGRLLGATIVAARAGELIHEPTLAMASRMFPGRLAVTTHAYPTWSTAVQQAAAQFFIRIDGRTARSAGALTDSRRGAVQRHR
jgi:pyruvate/2-oxoglutarate dehydrogenase complex dihydrolipoamide dehydrogenase (E3) component